jgi:protein FAM50
MSIRYIVLCLADFLPDAQRARAMEDMRFQLKQQWMQEQEQMKKEQLSVQFSYWDGSGHKRSATVAIGDTVGTFLKVAKGILEKDFPNLRHVTIPNLLFVKDNIMIPQGLSFYFLLVGRAHNGKGQILFQQGPCTDSGKAHAAKVVQRSWYESNKHIYPANRWEIFDDSRHISD